MDWRWKKFEALTLEELYSILHLRQKVFCVEQKCPYLDIDRDDSKAWHLMGYEKGELLAYLRAFPPGVKYAEMSLGRVVTSFESRGLGYGREVFQRGIALAQQTFGPGPIRIAAQAYLEKFYREAGFERMGEPYLEDDIPHIEMALREGVLFEAIKPVR